MYKNVKAIFVNNNSEDFSKFEFRFKVYYTEIFHSSYVFDLEIAFSRAMTELRGVVEDPTKWTLVTLSHKDG